MLAELDNVPAAVAPDSKQAGLGRALRKGAQEDYTPANGAVDWQPANVSVGDIQQQP